MERRNEEFVDSSRRTYIIPKTATLESFTFARLMSQRRPIVGLAAKQKLSDFLRSAVVQKV